MAPVANPTGITTTGSGRSVSSGSARASSRRGRASGSARGNLGAGLVDVPPVPYRDPATVVLANAVLPEAKRFCGACGQPVGRARGEREGKTDGYCPHCGHPFSFTPKLRTGDVVAGQYEVAGPIAHGGLGWIYLARDRNVSDRWVVLKGLLDSGDPSAMAAAIAERKFLARVEHPNIVRIYNFVTHDAAGYIVMEYVGGSSLKDLRRAQPLPVPQAIAHIVEILPALGYLHNQGLLYCDFKPDNVIQNEEQLKLIDLGGVRGIDDDASDLYGTAGYQAPEVPDTGATISSDLYTVARTLAVLSFDFGGFQDPARFAARLPDRADVAVLSRYDAFDRFLRRGANPDPDRRFESAADMAEQLVGVLRQVVAADGGRPDPVPSRVFTAELLTDVTRPSWRDLPAPTVDAGDPAAGLLAGLAAAPPEQLLAALAGVPATPETRYQLIRAHAGRAEFDLVADELRLAAADDPGDWRVAWWTGIVALAGGRSDEARRALGAVADVLPGELAPTLALAAAAETSGAESGLENSALEEAARLYEAVAATDPGLAGAAFGLARVRLACGDRNGAAAALAALPSRSSFHRVAQETRCGILLARVGGDEPGVAHIAAAAEALDALVTDSPTRLRLTRALLVAILAAIESGAGPPPPTSVPTGVEPTEAGIRLAAERTCRSLARLAGTDAERIALVDEANAHRPRTLV